MNRIERRFSATDGSPLAPVTVALAVAASQDISRVGLLVDGNAAAATAVIPGTAHFARHSLFVVDAADAWTGGNLLAGTPMLALERRPGAEQGLFYARSVSAASVFTKLHPSLVSMLDASYTEGKIGYAHRNSDIAGIRFLSRAISREYIANNGTLAASTIESATRMAALGAVPRMTMIANQAASNAMSLRARDEPSDGIQVMAGNSAPVEDALKGHGRALWIMPIFRNANGFGMRAGNWNMDFSGNLGGIAAGGDYTLKATARCWKAIPCARVSGPSPRASLFHVN